MISRLTKLSVAMTLVMTGSIAGLYYAFFVSVMPGLDEVEPGQAISVMQSINREIQNPVFFLTFFGTPVAAVVTGSLLRRLGQERAGRLCFLAAAIYILGSLMPTIIVNVPMNNDLDATTVPKDPQQAARVWSDFSSRWTRWNALRATLTTVSLLVTGLAMYVWGQQRNASPADQAGIMPNFRPARRAIDEETTTGGRSTD